MDNKGLDFEYKVYSFYEEREFPIFDTPQTNDYGADLILYFHGTKIVIQCKYHAKPIGISAVQEVIGAIPYYDAEIGMVVSNQSYTKQAKVLAAANRIILVGGRHLDTLLDDMVGIEYLEQLVESVKFQETTFVKQQKSSWIDKVKGLLKK